MTSQKCHFGFILSVRNRFIDVQLSWHYSVNKQSLPQQKIQNSFVGESPISAKNNLRFGGNMDYFERTFIQDFKNIGEKIHLLSTRERYWLLDYYFFLSNNVLIEKHLTVT